jgi:hypothetical protein
MTMRTDASLLKATDNAGSLPTYVLPPPPGLRDVDYCNQFEYETCVVRIALASCTPPTGLKMEVVMGPAAWGESDGASRVSQCRRAQSRTFNWTRLWTPPTCAATHDTYSHPHTSHHRLASARAPTTHTCPQGAGGRGGGGSLRVARRWAYAITSQAAPRRKGVAPPPVVSYASAGGFVGRTTT